MQPEKRRRAAGASSWAYCAGALAGFLVLVAAVALGLVIWNTVEIEELETRLREINIKLANFTGTPGPPGPRGPQGFTGLIGPNGTVVPLDFADFYALMPGDNSATVGLGAAVQFPQNGPTSAGGITRLSASTFQLAAIGTYQILWQVSVSEPGQLVLGINGVEQAATVVGRATGTSQIVGVCYFSTVLTNRVLSVMNPAGNSAALTITPIAGGASAVSAHLVITRVV